MPCWTVQSNKVEFLEKHTDLDLLKKTLEKMGFTVQKTATGLSFNRGYGEYGTYEKRSGKITLPNFIDVAEVKRGYSEQVVEHALNKEGWKFEWSTNKSGNREATVIKRG